MAGQKVLSSAKAAKQLGVSVRAIQLWVEQGVLPAWKTPGGHRRIPVEAVEELIAKRNAQVQAQPKKEKQAPVKILLVEDESYLRKLYTKYVESLDYAVELELADNGFQGLIKLGQIKPDLLITDLMMPGMDGIEMIRTIHDNNYLENQNIVVVTATDPGAPEVAALRKTRVRVLHKPLLLDDIKTLLDEQMEK